MGSSDRWDINDTTIIQLEATYTRKDDRKVTIPASHRLAPRRLS